MAGTTGLEPATSAVTGQRSNQLSYVPRLLRSNWIWRQVSASLQRSIPLGFSITKRQIFTVASMCSVYQIAKGEANGVQLYRLAAMPRTSRPRFLTLVPTQTKP